MHVFSKFSLKNPVAIVILVLLITYGGVYSASKFKQESMPDLSIPYLFISAVYPGAAPQEVQNEVAVPIEKALGNIEGIQSVESTSAGSIATVMLTFPFSADMKEKQAKVEEALNTVKLPDRVERPTLSKISFDSGPMLYTSVTAKNEGTGITELQKFAKTVVPTLSGLDGVGKVQTTGLSSEHVYIKPDAAKMAAKGVTYQQVSQVLQGNNVSLPLGEATFNKLKQPVLITGRVKTAEELKNFVVNPVPEVRLRDIATVSVGSQQPDTITRVNGRPAVGINIVKNADANSVEVSKAVMEKLQQAVQDNGKLELHVVYDSANEVKKSINGMLREGLLGALFASIVILFFLRNVRATIIAIVSIPLSILVALALLKNFTGITLNIMSLGGMAVAVGRVVDDSIVVIENIVRRMQKERVTKELILDATREVGGAITSSTITTVAVFAPLALVGGLIGRVFEPFALTVVFSLLASLLVAVTVVPLMAYFLMRRHKPREHSENRVGRGYKRVLEWSLNRKWAVILIGLLLLGGTVPLYQMAGMTFIPEQKEKYMMINFTMPKGTDTVTVDKTAASMDEKLRDSGRVLLSQVTSGGNKGEFDMMTMSSGDSNKATWVISLDPKTDVTAFLKRMKKELDPGVEGAHLEMNEITVSAGGFGIFIIITGNDMKDIRQATDMITEAIAKVPGTDSVRNTLKDEIDTVELQVRQADAVRNGLSTYQAFGMLQPVLNEQHIGKLGEGSRMQDVYLSLQGVPRTTPADLGNLPLLSPLGKQVAVKDIADVKTVKRQSVLQLRGGSEFATVMGSITEKDTGAVNREIKEALNALKLPAGVEWSIDGADKQIADMQEDMGMAMLVAIGMVYIVMVVAFGGGKAPFAILFSLPFAVIGALAGTLIANEPVSVASLIGMLMLIGIVVTNAIVLVDRVRQQTENGMSIRDALLEAGATRLRPILMTAIATIFALLPLALGLGEGAIISKGLAVVVIGGLTTSTLLTLVVVPVMYELLHYRKSRRERMYAKRGNWLKQEQLS